VATPGGAPTLLTLRGTAVGPALSLSAAALGFGFVPLESAAAAPPKFLQLDNASDAAVPFELDAGAAGGVFECTPACGLVPPKAFVQIAVCFRPTTPANFHRRLTILLEHAPPLACDLIGAGFTPKAQPPALPPAVLAAHRGAGGAPTPPLPPGAPPPLPRDLAAEYILGDDACGIALDAQELDFGACGAMRPPEVRVVTFHNRTGTTVEVFWHKATPPAAVAAAAPLPFARSSTAAALSPAAAGAAAFVVMPETLEVGPNDVAVFRVSFRPTKCA
jgi:hypothetical protein